MFFLYIAQPHEYLAITGLFIPTVRIAKTAWVWIGLQRVRRISVQPRVLDNMDLQAMTKDKLQILLPAVLTIGPDVNSSRGGANNAAGGGLPLSPIERENGEKANQDDDGRGDDDALVKYAMFFAPHQEDNNKGHAESFVKSAIEGEIHDLVSGMTIEEILNNREVFRRRIYRSFQSVLNQFGVRLYNANVTEVKDGPDSNYLRLLTQLSHERSAQATQSALSETRLREAEGTAAHNQRIARINANTAVQEAWLEAEEKRISSRLFVQQSHREVEEATIVSHHSQMKANLRQGEERAWIQAQYVVETQHENSKREVERLRAAAELERMRATVVVPARAQREAVQQAVDAWTYFSRQEAEVSDRRVEGAADASAYRVRTLADARTDALDYRVRTLADAGAHDRVTSARADREGQRETAEAIERLADAYSTMSEAMGGGERALLWFLVERGMLVDYMRAHTQATRASQPRTTDCR